MLYNLQLNKIIKNRYWSGAQDFIPKDLNMFEIIFLKGKIS